MRTIAALTMVMAIVVAAIPVENYGTMRAANNTTADLKYSGDMAKLSDDYKDQYDPSTYEGTLSSAPSDQLTIQRIEDNTLLNLYTAVKRNSNSDTAVIVDDEIMSRAMADLEIRKLDCYNYVELNGDFTTVFNDTFKDISFKLEFSDADTYSAVGGTSTPAAGGTSISFDAFTIPTINSTVSQGRFNKGSLSSRGSLTPATGSGLSLVNARDYISYDLDKISTSNIVQEIFTLCASDTNTAKQGEIKNYNDKVEVYINTLRAIQARIDNNTATNQDKNDWDDIKNKMSNAVGNVGSTRAEYNNAKVLEMSFNQFTERGSNGLTLLADYMIRKTICNQNASGKTLADCELVNVSLPSGGNAYIPKLKSGASNAGNQPMDNDRYLVGGKVEIEGIKSKAFEGNAIVENLVIDDEITYIGQEAFKQSALRNISIGQDCKIIGDRAFQESNYLEVVRFTGNTPQLKTIGKQAFENVKKLTSFVIPESVTTIGAGCFANSVLATLTFKEGGQEPITVLPYAFYGCLDLGEVSFPGNKEIQIKKAAFAVEANHGGGEGLKNFVFPAKNKAIDYDNPNPTLTKSQDDTYDYILANRRFLETVTLPGSLNSTIPNGTFAGCSGLKNVIFPDDAKTADYDPKELFQGVMNADFYVTGPAEGVTSGSKATPRMTTWKAQAGYDDGKGIVPYMFKDSTGTHYEIGDQKDTDGVPQYIARIDVISESPKEAALVKYTPNKNNLGDNIPITVPDKVGGDNGYKVVAIGKDCFDDELKGKISELIIKDDSIRRIEDEAFKDATNLQWVQIGDAVSYIGKNAFAGCSKLENVVFSQNQTAEWYGQDNYWAEALKIDDDAFKTGSQYLTFHGAIHPDYAPFKLAMSENNESMLNTKSRICYKTDAPLNLIVIRGHEYTQSDNTKFPEKVTLIDYPHYEEIDTVNKALKDAMQEQYNKDNTAPTSDYSITDKFEAVNGVRKTTVDYSSYETMWDAEAEVVQQVLNLYLPKGIESIDARGYYNNSENANDLKYLILDYTRKESTDTNGNTTVEYERNEKRDRNLNPYGSGEKDVKSLYSNYEGVDTDEVKTVPGLISGYFNETSQLTKPTEDSPISDSIKGLIWRKYNDHYYTEINQRGNDYLTRVTMPTIERIPDYGFDSSENLKEITIGNALDEVGVQPFRDCQSLWLIDTADSTKYEFENMILYDKSPADGTGGYKIVQGLEGRGRSDVTDGEYGSSVITADTNPLLTQVTDIEKYAFANNKNVYEIDLSKSNVRNIMEGTFNDCNNLRTVVLPERTRNISDFAFGGVDESFTLTIPNKDCQISQKAFMLDEKDTSGVGHITIKGIKFEDEATNDTSVTYDSFLDLQKTYGDKKVEWSELGKSYTLRFYDDTWKLIASETVDVKDGETSASLSQPPADPVKTGYKFDTWVCPKVLDKDGNPLMGAATYTNVTEDRDIYATFKEDPTSVVPDGKDYTLTVENGKALVNGTIISTFPTSLRGGTTVTVIANNEENFKVWTITPGTYTPLITSPSIFTTTFTMPNANVTVTANTAIGGSTDTPNPDGTYTVTVNNGTGGGNYRSGVTVTITANTPPSGQTFTNWTTTTAGVTLANANSNSTTFVMPSSNVTVTANYSGGNQGGNTDDGTKKYKVTVNYGSGSGEYAAGATVNIAANAPESSNRVFSRWTTSNSGLGFANANSVSTSFVMPATDVTVTANYRTRTNDDDDDDDDSPSRRPGTNTNTNTVTNRPSSSTNTTGTTTGTVTNTTSGTGSTGGAAGNTDGNRIYITKNGISNTDVASLAVSGSTDNFIVRITESPEATAAVEQALTNTYGSLNGLAYLPMDISLYDSTGQNKITDSTGLNITVTMPIPDVLIQYGGNARVAAADNGNLVQLTPRFTTIDGIACISFVPPHFSPYVIYVDTNNLIAGQMLDSTPATGDPIHPKWFAAIGMACVSILLFVFSDGRKRRKYRAA